MARIRTAQIMAEVWTCEVSRYLGGSLHARNVVFAHARHRRRPEANHPALADTRPLAVSPCCRDLKVCFHYPEERFRVGLVSFTR